MFSVLQTTITDYRLLQCYGQAAGVFAKLTQKADTEERKLSITKSNLFNRLGT